MAAYIDAFYHLIRRGKLPTLANFCSAVGKVNFMLITTTSTLQGLDIVEYRGLVTGEAILGANVFKDLFAGIRDIVGGRSGAYEEELARARQIALTELQDQAAAIGANAVIGIDLDYETVGSSGSMLMVTATGTAVVVR